MIVMLAGLATMARLSIGLGLLVTRVLEPAWGMGAADERVNRWLAHTGRLPHGCVVGRSTLAGGVVLPIVVGSVAVVCAVLRVADRGIRRLRARRRVRVLPPDNPCRPLASSPRRSSRGPARRCQLSVRSHRRLVAVYGGLALLLTSRLRHRASRALVWTFAVGIVAFVALSRIYRGMHHPLDVAGGIVVGTAP